MSLKRFHVQGSSGYMSESANGEYVKFESAERLAALLAEYVAAHPAFRVKPIGAPGSIARAEQDAAIQLENAARAAL